MAVYSVAFSVQAFGEGSVYGISSCDVRVKCTVIQWGISLLLCYLTGA